ncbi:MAG TPA: primosomal protein N', partial [Pyrinomonadaceae bacterium]|nr:primosomal protein N' [Pyrinomonadaceae bacterium]
YSPKRESATNPRYAEVAVPLHVSQTFTYHLKPSLRSGATIGSRIQVPLGKTVVTGYIVGLHDELKADAGFEESSIKDAENILDTDPVCTPEVLEITRWVSDYYASPWGEVIKAALPPGISPNLRQFLAPTERGKAEVESLSSDETTLSARVLITIVTSPGEIALDDLSTFGPRAQVAKVVRELEQQGLVRRLRRPGQAPVKEKLQRTVRLLPPIEQLAPTKITAAQSRVLQRLSDQQALPLKELLKSAEVSISAVKTLVKKGAVEIFDLAQRRDPLEHAALPAITHHQLTDEQTAVLTEIEQPLKDSIYAAFLLHGVTGSGKTEVYIRAMRTALKQGRSAMMLVPEIALTPVFSRRLRSEFGDLVAIFHSSLPKGERFDEWMRVKNGEARVVIGTRSAVFAPAKNLGLVIIDEEHESTYRQQDSPYYNGRDTAIVRAQKESAVVILGSATPSLESFHNARTDKYCYLTLTRRIGNRPMAEAQIIDMRDVFSRHGRPTVFSDELLEAIRNNQQRKEQTIILLNRRGFSSFVLCRSCGETVQCPNCDVTLTYHRSEGVIICHYCNHREPPPSQCPNCGKKYIFYVGEGTEQIEQLLKDLFPDLRIARIDRDTTSRRSQFEKSLLDFGAGRLDMLVGTQMLAKGHDFPNVTLVGVVSVDAGLALPDFRAAERTFQLITQVAGRAGRGERPGQVLIQTYHPNHYALRHACAQDYAGFYTEELRYRQNHLYPPFVALGLLLVHGTDLQRVRSDAVELRKELDLANKDRSCRILGPAPAPLARLKGEHRFQLLIKSRNRRQLRLVAESALKAMIHRGLNP